MAFHLRVKGIWLSLRFLVVIYNKIIILYINLHEVSNFEVMLHIFA